MTEAVGTHTCELDDGRVGVGETPREAAEAAATGEPVKKKGPRYGKATDEETTGS